LVGFKEQDCDVLLSRLDTAVEDQVPYPEVDQALPDSGHCHHEQQGAGDLFREIK
jgi:hypothetical protein|tara:strand:- start:1065 stop:1229 length:165 start_codon:yes stop_codon:yes gene_type:complete